MSTTTKIHDLPTPCFLVDRERVQANTQRMLDTCKRLGPTLRPHTKTHKTVELAEMSTGGVKKGIAVSTLAEAEMYADAGFDDILYAYPITQEKIDRCVKLMSRLSEFHVMVSNMSGVECLKSNEDKLPEGKTWSVALEINCGYGRTGFTWDDDDGKYDEAFESIQTSMKLVSLYTHCGHSYSQKNERDRKASNSNTVYDLKNARSAIKYKYPDSDFKIGIGSTPSCSHPSENHKEVDEFHPGTYVFNDYQQYLLNSCRETEIACRVMTRVIDHDKENRMLVVDCGYLALGHEGMALSDEYDDDAAQRPEHQYCLFEGESNLKLVATWQEMSKIKAKVGELSCSKYPIGTVLFIYPYKVCLTAALHDVYYMHSGDEVVGTLKPCKGW